MKLLFENWREYVAKETGGEQVEMLEKLLKMEFAQAMHIIDSLKSDENDYRLEDDYEEALEEEYKNSQREKDRFTGLYYMHFGDGADKEEKAESEMNTAKENAKHFAIQWDAMNAKNKPAMKKNIGKMEEENKEKKPCKPSKGKRSAKRVDGKCRSFGQAGKAKDGGDRIRPGTAKGDAYCARSAKIKKCKNPPCANDLSRKKWKCRGSKSVA
tara:strand:- start:869 stop:1507 length:639 start_codon:yes stop_codon:yes gene_type:complete